jgi:hypothetical protein
MNSFQIDVKDLMKDPANEGSQWLKYLSLTKKGGKSVSKYQKRVIYQRRM